MPLSESSGGASSGEPAHQQYILDRDHIVAFGVTAGLELCLIVFASLQLLRLFRASAAFGRSLLAKKLFAAFLLGSALLRETDSLFILFSPCWRVQGGESWLCWDVNDATRRLAALSLFLAFFTVVVAWSEFAVAVFSRGRFPFLARVTPLLKAGACVIGALVAAFLGFLFGLHSFGARKTLSMVTDATMATFYCLAGLLIALVGYRVVQYLWRHRRQARVDSVRLIAKVSIGVLVCSLLLVSRSIWLLVVTLIRVRSGGVMSVAQLLVYYAVFDFVPGLVMIWLMWPISKRLHPSASARPLLVTSS